MPSEPKPFDPYQGCDVLRTVVERALAAFPGLSPAELEELRDFLIVHTTTHPAMEPLYARLKRRKAGGKSQSGVRTAPTEDDTLTRALAVVARAARGGRS